MTEHQVPLRDRALEKRPGKFGDGEQPPPPDNQGKTAEEVQKQLQEWSGKPVQLVNTRRRPKDK